MTSHQAYDRLYHHLVCEGHLIQACPESFLCRVTDPDEFGDWSFTYTVATSPFRIEVLAKLPLPGLEFDDICQVIWDLNLVNAEGGPGTFSLHPQRREVIYRAHFRIGRNSRAIGHRVRLLWNDLQDAMEVLVGCLRRLDDQAHGVEGWPRRAPETP